MRTTGARERRELLRGALIVAAATFLAIGPTMVFEQPGVSAPDLLSLATAAVVAIVIAAVDAVKTRRRWRSTGVFSLRLAIRDAVRAKRLPDDADPETWTYPVADQLRTARSGPWLAVSALLAVGMIAVLLGLDHRLGVVAIVLVSVQVAVLLVLLITAIRDRFDGRGPVLAAFLDELDARAAEVQVDG